MSPAAFPKDRMRLACGVRRLLESSKASGGRIFGSAFTYRFLRHSACVLRQFRMELDQ